MKQNNGKTRQRENMEEYRYAGNHNRNHPTKNRKGEGNTEIPDRGSQTDPRRNIESASTKRPRICGRYTATNRKRHTRANVRKNRKLRHIDRNKRTQDTMGQSGAIETWEKQASKATAAALWSNKAGNHRGDTRGRNQREWKPG